jgi:peroxiredoxin Q/BCP
VKIFGVSFDTEAENRAFAEKFDFNYPLLCDTDRSMGLAYGACDAADAGCAKRISIVIDADGNVEQVIDPVDAGTHPETLLASL